MFLEGPDAIPPVLPVEVLSQAIPCAIGPHETGKGAGALICQPQKSHIVYLKVVLSLSFCQPIPVYFCFRPMRVAMVCRCRPHSELNPHSGQGVCRQSVTRYESPTPESFKAFSSADIPDLSALCWNFIERDLATLAARPYY